MQITEAKPPETKAQAKRREKLAEARAAAEDYKARQRMLGNIQFIGQLYIKKMLTERIMHECIVKLLGEVGPPSLCSSSVIVAACRLSFRLAVCIGPPQPISSIHGSLWAILCCQTVFRLRLAIILKPCAYFVQVSNPRQEDVESLVKLVRTIGGTLEESPV